jgi:hypothetical protein
LADWFAEVRVWLSGNHRGRARPLQKSLLFHQALILFWYDRDRASSARRRASYVS